MVKFTVISIECNFAVTLPKAPVSVNADLMTIDDIRAKLKEGYGDIEKGNVQDASAAFQKFWDTHMKQYSLASRR
jgi:DNA-damage-inducible protein J